MDPHPSIIVFSLVVSIFIYIFIKKKYFRGGHRNYDLALNGGSPLDGGQAERKFMSLRNAGGGQNLKNSHPLKRRATLPPTSIKFKSWEWNVEKLARTFQGSPAFSPGSPDRREKSTPHRQIYIRRWRHSILVMEGSLLIGATDLPSFIYETCPLLSFIAVYSLRYYSLSELLRFISFVIRRSEICLCV